MKSLAILCIVVIARVADAGQSSSLFETDVRVRVVHDDLLYVVVQIDNHSGRTVTELEGFLTETDPSSTIISEKEITHLHSYEPHLKDGQVLVRGVTYPYDKAEDHRYGYHISHIKFRNDPRIFVFSPGDGLIRIK